MIRDPTQYLVSLRRRQALTAALSELDSMAPSPDPTINQRKSLAHASLTGLIADVSAEISVWETAHAKGHSDD